MVFENRPQKTLLQIFFEISPQKTTTSRCKGPQLSVVKKRRCFSFPMNNLSHPVTYRDDATLDDATIIMLHSNDGTNKSLAKAVNSVRIPKFNTN